MTDNKTKTRAATFRTLWKYIREYRFMLITTLLLAFICVSLTIYVPILVGKCIDLIVGAGKVDFEGILKIILQIGIIVILTAIFQWLMDILNNKITYQTMRDIRNHAFNKIQKLELKYIDSHSHGDLLSRVITDVDQLSDGLLMGFTQLFSGVLTILGILIFMFIINPLITLVVVILTPLSLFAANFIAKRTYDMFHLQSSIRGEQTAFLDEIIGQQKVVQAFSQEKNTQSHFDEINGRLEKSSLKAIFFSSLINPSTRFINGIIYTAVVLIGSSFTISGAVTVGGLFTFLSYVNQYTKPFNEISGVIAELQNALACASRIFELIDDLEQSPDEKNAHILDVSSVEGNISIENVNFSYTAEKKLIRNFNLRVSSGQRIAIVGPTGCGKTTMINLLMRFYEIDEGRITLEGLDIRDITRNSLRKSFGMVLQDTWLREGSIFENIVMGKPDATRNEVINAAKAVHAHSFIKRLPNGYDTIISSDDGGLSQGQRQMLCITRLMLCLPPMLILDEATSSIDTRTELLIQEAFAKLMQNRTSFIVAHRLSTIRSADVILVMRDGNVVEQGKHEELLNKNGFYAELYNSQFSI